MNKRLSILLVFTILAASTAAAQWMGDFTMEDENQVDGGLGVTWIDGEAWYSVGIAPDLSFGKLGFGLNIQLLFNAETGQVRTIDWDTPEDYARLIRYIRYGKKGDPFYSRIGALDRARLGHGYLLNFYRNQINYDERKIGLIADADLGVLGFESMTNTLGRFEVMGMRIYYRPLWESRIPILKHIAVGTSFVTDLNPDAHRDTDDDVAAWGVDIELPLIKSLGFNAMLYADHAQLIEYGSGQAVGISTEFDGLLGFAKFGVAFERRWMAAEFEPNFFGPFYEIQRYAPLGDLINHYETLGGDSTGLGLSAFDGSRIAKHTLLPMLTKSRKGWFGAVYVDMLHLVKAVGSYEMIDELPNSGELHLDVRLSPSIPFIAAEAGYDKSGMNKLKNMFKLDEKSVAWVGLGYKINPYMLVFMDYIWNYKWDEDSHRYKTQKRFSPRLAFRYHF